MRELGREFETAGGGNVEVHIVAVTHGGFVHFLTQDWDGINPAKGEYLIFHNSPSPSTAEVSRFHSNMVAYRYTSSWLGTGWENAEYRSYQFHDPAAQDLEARMTETRDSWRARRGSQIGLTAAEQTQLRSVQLEVLQRELDEIDAAKKHAAQ
jgi:hypothetical protein